MPKTVVITGATSGIGFETAKAVAAKGYNIITIGRNQQKGQQLTKLLREVNHDIIVENFIADLSDLSTVSAAASEIAAKHRQVDRLINNAGFFPANIEYTGNIENTLYASHLGHMLLTELLLPLLQRSGEGRVINVSSALHTQGDVSRFFSVTKDLTLVRAYADAKLANVLFTLGLSRKLPPEVTTFALHPGVVRTNFAKNARGLFSLVFDIFRPFFISPERGAKTTVFLADTSIEKIKDYSGGYFVKSSPAQTRNKGITEDNAMWLFKRSEEILQPYLKPV